MSTLTNGGLIDENAEVMIIIEQMDAITGNSIQGLNHYEYERTFLDEKERERERNDRILTGAHHFPWDDGILS